MSGSFNNFNQVAQGLYDALGDVVAKTAFDIEASYQANAARDTGFMANSAYVVTDKSSDYGKAGSPTHKDSYLLPEVDAPPDQFTAYVAVGANYGIFQEYGTRHAPAQPALIPAVDSARGSFEAAVEAIESKLK
jgi:hypothetical protein